MAARTAKIKGNNLSDKTIHSIFQLQRSFIYCRCKTKYEGQAGFYFVLGLLYLNLHPELMTLLPSKK